ncbi:SOS response-associated peptidase [Primorskyibacter flagellatus]|uniref:SOS response-associated peptidase n=1 Tax=Primorskyibacter flagellatus TaxID=1387277 RepID=UPI003A8DEB61
MCNLYSNTTAQEAMRQLFKVAPGNDLLGNAEPLTAIWPKYQGHVVRLNPDGVNELVSLSWGFRTTNTSKKTGKTLQPSAWNNARDDKLLTSGLWKGSFQERRCLIPATSFCEAKGRNPATYHWFGLTGDEPRPAFAFAGLWTVSHFEGPDGKEECACYTMITTRSNELVKPIHPDRMPAMLAPKDYAQWMNGTASEAHELLRPYPADAMQVLKSGETEKSDAV